MDTLQIIKQTFNHVGEAVEAGLDGYEKWQVVAGTVAVTLAATTLMDLYYRRLDVYLSGRDWVFRVIRSIPAVKRYIATQMEDSRRSIEKDMFEDAMKEGGMKALSALPDQGWGEEQLLQAATQILGQGKFDWKDGMISGGSFSGADKCVNELVEKIYGLYALSNPLHSDIFPGVRKMEAEVVRITVNLFHGTEEQCGSISMGGSESILLAVKASRDWGRHVKGVEQPEIVACVTLHAAFDKSATILDMKLRKVPMDPRTCKADVRAMRRAITSNTVLLVASAPQFPHGIIDDVEAIGELGQRYNIPVHVDCCMGGFLLPFMEAAGYSIPPFDFRVPGVTSISADTHKYGNCPKGTSVVMYRSADYRHHQYFSTPDWPGGIYATPTVPGSRPGGSVAVCWATLMYYGMAGYVKATKGIISTARKIKQLLTEIEDIELFGDPLTSIVGFTSKKVDILKVGDIMTQAGWHLTFTQYPPGLHICLTVLQAESVNYAERLVAGLKEAVDLVKKCPMETGGVGKVYGTAAAIPDKSLISEAGKIFLSCYYETEPHKQAADGEQCTKKDEDSATKGV